ncbi:MAG: ribulose-phosphate 3-epimerase [Nitrospirae bacterium]|nr:ribulose-phosphate 3-epimerase [Nitrospirota bacterium]
MIAPSILSADFTRLGDEIRLTQEAGADILHIDIMDGSFVPNISIGYFIVEQIKKITTLPLDVHLMIENPQKYIKNFIDAGADYLSIHLESERHLHRAIQMIKEQGVKSSVAINPATSVSALDSIIEELDMVVLMSVNPGFGGQKFIPSTIEKIKQLKTMIDNKRLKTLIQIDGGVSNKNVSELVKAGASIFVMGSAFYNSPSYSETVRIFKLNVSK